MISVQNLSFSYHNAPILHDVSFTIEEGSVLCILGSNGTGKTTLLRCLLGFLQPNSGHITIGEKKCHGSKCAKTSTSDCLRSTAFRLSISV